MAVTAVFLDVGETLVDETRQWEEGARALGVTGPTLLAAIGAAIERGEHHRRAFELLERGEPDWTEYTEDDLYPDALPCLARLRAAGFTVGVAGNQPWRLNGLFGAHVDHVFTSATLGVEKPSPEFFARVVEAARCTPQEIAFVGDRVDNDVVPALAAGMVAVHIRRGPWGHLQQGRERAHVLIDSLDELPAALL